MPGKKNLFFPNLSMSENSYFAPVKCQALEGSRDIAGSSTNELLPS